MVLYRLKCVPITPSRVCVGVLFVPKGGVLFFCKHSVVHFFGPFLVVVMVVIRTLTVGTNE